MYNTRTNDVLTALTIIEGVDCEPTYEEIVDAYQFLINSRIAWRLQGCYVRAANRLIESGECYYADLYER